MEQLLSQKTRTNAMIAYFFLGWLFLLARKNPDFSEPFVRAHSKTATKGHILFLGGYFVYVWYLAQMLPAINIPLLPGFSLDRIISIILFLLLAGFIVRGAYLAQKGTMAEQVASTALRDAFRRENIAIDGATESEKMIYVSSYIPFFGIIAAGRHPNPITRVGVKIGSIVAFLLVALTVFGNQIELIGILLFVYLLFVAFVGVSLFVQNVVVGFSLFEKIPNLSSVYAFVRVLPAYGWKLVRAIF